MFGGFHRTNFKPFVHDCAAAGRKTEILSNPSASGLSLGPLSISKMVLHCLSSRQKRRAKLIQAIQAEKHTELCSYCLFLNKFNEPRQSKASKNWFKTQNCSSPRKSLVKGERFIRSEEKPEYAVAFRHTGLG